MDSADSNSRARVVAGLTILVVVGLLAGGIWSLTDDRRPRIMKAGAEYVGLPLTAEQENYVLETGHKGTVTTASLSNMNAPAIFLNFFATYCPPCVEELPSLISMAQLLTSSGLIVVAVSYDSSFEQIDELFQQFPPLPPNFFVVRDPAYPGQQDMKSLFGTEKLPESYVIVDRFIEVRFVSTRDWMNEEILSFIADLIRR